MVLFGKSNIPGIYLLRTKKNEKNQATNYITTIPFWTSKTCHARPADRDLFTKKMVVESLWCETDPPGIFQHTYQVLTKKDLGNKNGDVHSVYTYTIQLVVL